MSLSKTKERISILFIGIVSGYLIRTIIQRLRCQPIKRSDAATNIRIPNELTDDHRSRGHSRRWSVADDESFQTTLLQTLPNSPTFKSKQMHSDHLISTLRLVRHEGGGYYRKTYKFEDLSKVSQGGKHETTVEQKQTEVATSPTQTVMNCVYWLQRSKDSKIRQLHESKCDSMFYYHHGAGLKFFIVDPTLNAVLITTLGPNLERGHGFQLIVPKHCWIATIIDEDDLEGFDDGDSDGVYSLVSEARCSGFAIESWSPIQWTQIVATNLSPNDKKLLHQFVHHRSDQ